MSGAGAGALATAREYPYLSGLCVCAGALSALALWRRARQAGRAGGSGSPEVRRKEPRPYTLPEHDDPVVVERVEGRVLHLRATGAEGAGGVGGGAGTLGGTSRAAEAPGATGPPALLDFASNDFLSLACDPGSKAFMKEAVRYWGVGSCGPRGFFGTTTAHITLEDELEQFMNQPAVVYSSAATVVPSIVPVYCQPGDTVIVDQECSPEIRRAVANVRGLVEVSLPRTYGPSALEGSKAGGEAGSRAEGKTGAAPEDAPEDAHGAIPEGAPGDPLEDGLALDPGLRAALRARERELAGLRGEHAPREAGEPPAARGAPGPSRPRNTWIIADSVTSDSALADLPLLLHLAGRYRLRICLNDSLGVGVLGATGRGLAEHWGDRGFAVSNASLDLVCASLEAALGGVGGVCSGSPHLTEQQRNAGLGYCFSAAAPPSTCEVVRYNLRQVPARCRELGRKSAALHAALEAEGVPHRGALCLPVATVLVPTSQRLPALRELRRRGFLCGPAQGPGIRVTVGCATAEDDVRALARALREVLAAAPRAAPAGPGEGRAGGAGEGER